MKPRTLTMRNLMPFFIFACYLRYSFSELTIPIFLNVKLFLPDRYKIYTTSDLELKFVKIQLKVKSNHHDNDKQMFVKTSFATFRPSIGNPTLRTILSVTCLANNLCGIKKAVCLNCNKSQMNFKPCIINSRDK